MASQLLQHKSLIQLQDTKNESQFDELTYRVHPIEKNKIFVRIENLADRFDSNENYESTVKYVNMMKFAKQFWQQANPGIK